MAVTGLARTRVSIFAVEDDSVQLVATAPVAAGIEIEIGDTRVPVGPGRLEAVTVTGLQPATRYDILVSGTGLPRRRAARATTLRPPPGRLLYRFATLNDIHLGERRFGFLGRIEERGPLPPGLEPYPLRAARAAVLEARAWGAQRIVVKGDLTHNSRALEFEAAGKLLGGCGVPSDVVLGNHDVRHRMDGPSILSRFGVQAGRATRALDVPGARLVFGHTPTSLNHWGVVPPQRTDELAALAGGAPGPAVVVLHHPPHRWPVATYYPPGIGWRDATRLLAALAEANPDVVILAGHTHRCRFYRAGGIPVAEVGSTKDYPGLWGGYAVYEGGIRQVVRRIARPDVLAWTEQTRQALGGLWGWWSPGRLPDRCWSLPWPLPTSRPRR